jgi:hypothetical protein
LSLLAPPPSPEKKTQGRIAATAAFFVSPAPVCSPVATTRLPAATNAHRHQRSKRDKRNREREKNNNNNAGSATKNKKPSKMASAAGEAGGGGSCSIGGSGGSIGDRVYAAVSAGKSDEEVRRVIGECANEQQRKAAVNHKGQNNDQTPLAAAHRLRRGDLVGALLEAGADASALSPRATPLVLCIVYGLVESLRALLKAGLDPNQRVEYREHDSLAGNGAPQFCTAAHLCLAPPRLLPGGPKAPPQLACLTVLVQEGKADLNATIIGQISSLHWLGFHVPPGDAHLAALDLLVRLGADVEARDRHGWTPLRVRVQGLPRGPAAADRARRACGCCQQHRIHAFDDCLLPPSRKPPRPPRRRARAPARLVARDAPGRGQGRLERDRLHCHEARPVARALAQATGRRAAVGGRARAAASRVRRAADHCVARRADRGRAYRATERREREVAARRSSAAHHWRAHEAMVGLALDMGELREAAKEVEEKRLSMAALELELCELGAGTESSDSEGEGESESGSGGESGGESESESESESGDDSESGEEQAATSSR